MKAQIEIPDKKDTLNLNDYGIAETKINVLYKCSDCGFCGDITQFPTTTYYWQHEEGVDKEREPFCPKCESEDIDSI